MTKKILGIIMGILILGVLTSPLTAAIERDTLLVQNFNGTWSTSSPPSGWTIIHTTLGGSNDPIGQDDWNRWYWNSPYQAGYYYYYETGIDRLFSPIINCAADPVYEVIWLQYWIEYSYYGGPYQAEVRGSNDGGASYPNMILELDEASYGPGDEFTPITSWALGQNDVRIDFYGSGYSWNINYWMIDSFYVIAEWDTATGGGEEADLAMMQIARPFDKEQADVAFKPKCKVWNPSNDTVIALVRCKMKDLSNMQTVYEKALSNFPFPPGYTDVEFNDYTPEGGKNFDALFVVECAEDPDTDNNDAEKDWSTELGVQVDATEILAPAADEIHLPFAPSCKFTEMLGNAAPEVTLWCAIDDVDFDSIPEPFDPDEVFTATFKTAEGLADGQHVIKFWAAGKGKQDPIGEVLVDTFNYLGIIEEPEVRRFDLAVAGRTVTFSLPEASGVNLAVYDVAGNLVTTLASGSYSAGSHVVAWNADAPSGLYFVRLVTPERSTVRKLTMLK